MPKQMPIASASEKLCTVSPPKKKNYSTMRSVEPCVKLVRESEI
jgi:hypothetical protein